MKSITAFVLTLAIATIAEAQEASVTRNGLLEQRDGVWVPASYSQEQINKAGMLCIRHNNYWCIKSNGWLGEVGKDERQHAIFEDARYGARAFFLLMQTYRFRHGLRSARQIMNRYAPATDCIGSLPRNEAGACPQGENPTLTYARRIAETAGVGLDDDLKFFNDDGTINLVTARAVARGVVQFELGRTRDVTDTLITDGITLAGIKVADVASHEDDRTTSPIVIDKLPATYPHGGSPRELASIDMIVLHTIGGPHCVDGQVVYTQAPNDAVYWRDDFAKRDDASIHYVVDRAGRIAQQRPEDRTAGHVASAAHPMANLTSIGIEMVNRGDGVEPFPEPLVAAVTALVKDIAGRHGLGPEAIRTHAELDTRMETCAGVAFPRKTDPGPLFPLDKVKAAVAADR